MSKADRRMVAINSIQQTDGAVIILSENSLLKTKKLEKIIPIIFKKYL
jgi:non-canonical (house-cleaning) NTP pyrophosphatase